MARAIFGGCIRFARLDFRFARSLDVTMSFGCLRLQRFQTCREVACLLGKEIALLIQSGQLGLELFALHGEMLETRFRFDGASFRVRRVTFQPRELSRDVVFLSAGVFIRAANISHLLPQRGLPLLHFGNPLGQ
jgi:hypothetical protein